MMANIIMNVEPTSVNTKYTLVFHWAAQTIKWTAKCAKWTMQCRKHNEWIERNGIAQNKWKKKIVKNGKNTLASECAASIAIAAVIPYAPPSARPTNISLSMHSHIFIQSNATAKSNLNQNKTKWQKWHN